MRKIVWLFILGLLLAPLSACENSSGPKIGVIDLNKLMRDSVPGKTGIKMIEEQQTKLQSRLDEIQAKLEKNPNDENALKELQTVYATAQQRIQAEGENIVGQLFDAIQAELEKFRAQNGYAILIRQEAADAFDPALDATNAAMLAIDKIQLNIKPLPEDKNINEAQTKESSETQKKEDQPKEPMDTADEKKTEKN